MKYPNYELISSVLVNSGFCKNLAQTHGELCATLCLPENSTTLAWIEEQIAQKIKSSGYNSEIKQIESSLFEIYQITENQLIDENLVFELYLPEDEEILSERVKALSMWCSGFLSMFMLFECTSFLSEDAKESLMHIEQASQINQDIIICDEEEEKAFLEIIEYIRAAIILIYLELHSGNHTIKKIMH